MPSLRQPFQNAGVQIAEIRQRQKVHGWEVNGGCWFPEKTDALESARRSLENGEIRVFDRRGTQIACFAVEGGKITGKKPVEEREPEKNWVEIRPNTRGCGYTLEYKTTCLIYLSLEDAGRYAESECAGAEVRVFDGEGNLVDRRKGRARGINRFY